MSIQDVKDIMGLIISLSSVLGIFTGIVNKLFSNKLKPLENKIEENEREGLKRDMMIMRSEVISFAANLHSGQKATRYQFEYIFDCMDLYEGYVNKLGLTNNLFTSEERYIKQKYQEFIEEKK